MDRVIVDHFGNGESQFDRELGAYLAQRTLADIRRFFGAPGLHDFFHHLAMLHREWYDFGSSEYVESSERSGCLLRRGYGAHSPLDFEQFRALR